MTTPAFLNDASLSWEALLDTFFHQGFIEPSQFECAMILKKGEGHDDDRIRQIAILSLCASLSIHGKEWSMQQVRAVFPSISFEKGEHGLLYRQIIFDLFELPIPEVEDQTIRSNLYQVVDHIEILLLKLFIGWFLRNEPLLKTGLEEAQWLTSTISREGQFLGSYWYGDALQGQQKKIGSALHYLCKALTKFQIPELSKNPINKPKEGEANSLQLACIRFLSELIDRQTVNRPVPPLPEEFKRQWDRQYGLWTVKFNGFQAVLDHPGRSQALGSFSLGKLFFPAFGPHCFPLGDMNRFGAHRHPRSHCFFSEEVQKERSLTFWNRLPSFNEEGEDQLSSRWIQTEIFAYDEGIDFTLYQALLEETPPYSFVFFVDATRLFVEQWGEIERMSLHKYQDVNRPIVLENQQGNLYLNPQFEGEMQIIPLNGAKHFWGASYLIAFVMTSELKKFVWKMGQIPTRAQKPPKPNSKF